MWRENGTVLLLMLVGGPAVLWADRLGDLTSAVYEHTSSDVVSDTVTRVKTENVTCDVYVYDAAVYPVDPADVHRKHASRFYTCVNCVFAGWLQDRLIGLVGRVPALYQPAMLSRHGGGWSRRLIDGSDDDDDGLERLAEFTARLVNVLFNFTDAYTDAYTHASTAVDVDLLKTLLRFGVAVDSLREAHAAGDGGGGGPPDDDAAIVVILRTANAAQKFRALNCDVSGPFYDDAPFYGYTRPRPAVTTESDVRRFLSDIRPVGLETHLERCTVGQMLLRDVLASGDMVAGELRHASPYGACRSGEDPPSIDARLAAKAARTHDLDVILWYQKVVYDALLKTLCLKVEKFMEAPFEAWPEKVTRGLDELRFLWAESTDAPPRVAQVLSQLADGERLDENYVWKVMSAFVMSKIRVPPATPLRLPSFDVSVDYDYAYSSLEPFMDAIINRVDDYKCFVRMFRTLNAEYRKYYLPHARNLRRVYKFVDREACAAKDGKSGSTARSSRSKTGQSRPKSEGVDIKDNQGKKSPAAMTLKVTTSEATMAAEPNHRVPAKVVQKSLNAVDLADNICLALIGMYQYCFETLLLLNDCRAAERREPGAGVAYCQREVGKNIEAVVWYAYVSSASSLRDHCVNKMSFDLTMMQRVTGDRLWEKGLFDELQRQLYLVMAALNECGLQFCRPPKYGYLLFNNVDVHSTGQHGRFHKWWTGFVQTVGLVKGAKLPKIDVLNEVYHRNAGDFQVYDNFVKLYWKGEWKTVDEIFRSVRSALSNPDFAYALYDVYFRFSLAVIYYETLFLFKVADAVYYHQQIQPQSLIDIFKGFWQRSEVTKNSFPRAFQTQIVEYEANSADLIDRVVKYGRFQLHSSDYKALKARLSALGIFIDIRQYVLPDSRSFVNQYFKEQDSYIRPRVNCCLETLQKINKSALEVKTEYAEFVKYYIDSLPGDHSDVDI